MLYPRREMDPKTPEQPPIAERLKLPQTEEDLEQRLNIARREGAVAAINSVHEEATQPLTVITGYMQLIERELDMAARTGRLNWTNFSRMTEHLKAISAAGQQQANILSKYQQAAIKGNIGFGVISGSPGHQLPVLDIHPQVQPPSTTQGVTSQP